MAQRNLQTQTKAEIATLKELADRMAQSLNSPEANDLDHRRCIMDPLDARTALLAEGDCRADYVTCPLGEDSL